MIVQADPYLRPRVGGGLERPQSQDDHLYTEAIFADDIGYLRPVDDGAETVRRLGGAGGGGRGGVVVRGSDRATYYPPHNWCPNRDPAEKAEDGLAPRDPASRDRWDQRSSKSSEVERDGN